MISIFGYLATDAGTGTSLPKIPSPKKGRGGEGKERGRGGFAVNKAVVLGGGLHYVTLGGVFKLLWGGILNFQWGGGGGGGFSNFEGGGLVFVF